MNRLIYLSICTVCVILANGIENYNIDSSVKIVENIEKFHLKNPNTTLVRLNKSIKTQHEIYYTFGNRVSGDKLIGSKSDSYHYPNPEYVQQHIWYPCCGVGGYYRVSFVDIYVKQSTSLGSAYIYSGGIGKYSIEIIIEAKRTISFSYEARIYGIYTTSNFIKQ